MLEEFNRANGWEHAPLETIASITKGRQPRELVPESRDSLPYLEAAVLRGQKRPAAVARRDLSSSVIAIPSDTLVIWDGANAGEAFTGARGVVASTMARIRSHSRRVLPEFLYHAVAASSGYLKRTSAGSTIPHVRTAHVRSLSIPLPPIPIQERAVQILTKANGVRQKRRQALEIVNAILPASFVDMFGDLNARRIAFTDRPLGQIAEVRAGVQKGRDLGQSQVLEVPYLRVANVQDGFLDLSEVKTIEIKAEELDKYRLRNGDILMTEGGDPDKLGRGCLWRDQIPNCIHQNHIFRVRVDRSVMEPEYLAALLRTQYAKQYFQRCAKLSSNLASVNVTQVRAFPVPVPALDIQRKFVSITEQWVQASERLVRAAQEADSLYSSVLRSVLSGEITSWWESQNAEGISRRVENVAQLPRRILLAFVSRLTDPAAGAEPDATVSVTALAGRVFLLEAEYGNGLQCFHFEASNEGLQVLELKTDLERLESEGLLYMTKSSCMPRVAIPTAALGEVDSAIRDLPPEILEAIDAVSHELRDLDDNALMGLVREKHPGLANA